MNVKEEIFYICKDLQDIFSNKISGSTIIKGKNCAIDSIEFVTLISEIEIKLKNNINIDISLFDLIANIEELTLDDLICIIEKQNEIINNIKL